MYNPISTPPFVPQQESIPQPQPEYQPKAKLTKGGFCPECGSPNYRTFGSYAIACGNCGYHPRFQQSGFGEPNLRDDGAQAARQSGDRQTVEQGIALLNAGGGDHIKSV